MAKKKKQVKPKQAKLVDKKPQTQKQKFPHPVTSEPKPDFVIDRSVDTKPSARKRATNLARNVVNRGKNILAKGVGLPRLRTMLNPALMAAEASLVDQSQRGAKRYLSGDYKEGVGGLARANVDEFKDTMKTAGDFWLNPGLSKRLGSVVRGVDDEIANYFGGDTATAAPPVNAIAQNQPITKAVNKPQSERQYKEGTVLRHKKGKGPSIIYRNGEWLELPEGSEGNNLANATPTDTRTQDYADAREEYNRLVNSVSYNAGDPETRELVKQATERMKMFAPKRLSGKDRFIVVPGGETMNQGGFARQAPDRLFDAASSQYMNTGNEGVIPVGTRRRNKQTGAVEIYAENGQWVSAQ